MKDFKFETAVRDQGFRMEDWREQATPVGRENLKSRGVFVSLYLTGESGRRYHGQRSFGHHVVGNSTVMSFCRLKDGERRAWPDELWDSPRRDQHDPYTYAEYDGRLVYATHQAEVEIRRDGWNWTDSSGRWKMHTKPLGDRGYYFWVPQQEDFPVSHFHTGQSHIAEGEIEGERVRGYGYLERAWGPDGPAVRFWQLPLVRKMNKLWMHWYASFEDGGYITGCARKGRLGVNWSMAYVVNDGKAEVITPTMTDVCYTKDGLVQHVRLNTGKQVLEFEQDCASYFPFHTMGRIESVTGRGKVVDSWTDIEWWPDNAANVIDYIIANETPEKGRFALFAEMPIIGENMIVPGA